MSHGRKLIYSYWIFNAQINFPQQHAIQGVKMADSAFSMIFANAHKISLVLSASILSIAVLHKILDLMAVFAVLEPTLELAAS